MFWELRIALLHFFFFAIQMNLTIKPKKPSSRPSIRDKIHISAINFILQLIFQPGENDVTNVRATCSFVSSRCSGEEEGGEGTRDTSSDTSSSSSSSSFSVIPRQSSLASSTIFYLFAPLN